MLLTYLSQTLTNLHFILSVITLFSGIMLFVTFVLGFNPTYPHYFSIKQLTIFFVISALLTVLVPDNLLQQRDNFWKNNYYEMKDNNEHHRSELVKANKQISEFNQYLTKYNRTGEFTEFYNSLHK